MQPARLTRPLSWVPTVILAGAFVVYLVLVAGCVQVGDRLTGVGVAKGRPTTCLKECNDQYKQLFDDEQKLHQQNVLNCQALSQPNRGPCLVAETARHEAAKDQLTQGKINCQNNCHHQGGGTAG